MSVALSLGVLGLLAAAGSASPASACRLEFSSDATFGPLMIDPFSSDRPTPTITATIRNDADVACQGEVVLKDDRGRLTDTIRLVSDDIELTFASRSGALANRGEAGGWMVSIGAQTIATVRLEGSLLDRSIIPAGVHEHGATIGLRMPGDPHIHDVLPVNIRIESPPRAQVNIAGADGAFDRATSISSVSFGDAATGKDREVFIQTRANSAARLSIVSGHRGRLMLDGKSESEASIAYSAFLDEAPINLGAPAFRDLAPSRSFSGRSLRLRLHLGDTRAARAGRYSDDIMIEISNL